MGKRTPERGDAPKLATGCRDVAATAVSGDSGAFAFSNSINALTIGGSGSDVVIAGSRSYSGDFTCPDSAGNHVSFRSSGDTKRAGTQRGDYPLSFARLSSRTYSKVCGFFLSLLLSYPFPYLLFLPSFYFPFFVGVGNDLERSRPIVETISLARSSEPDRSPLSDIALHSAHDLR